MGSGSKVTGMDALQSGKEVSPPRPALSYSSFVYILSPHMKYKPMECRDYVLPSFDVLSKVPGTVPGVLWMFKKMFRTKNPGTRDGKREEGKGKNRLVILKHLKDEGSRSGEGL